MKLSKILNQQLHVRFSRYCLVVIKFFTLYSAKYIKKKKGFKSSAQEDATFHSTFISHTQIGGKLENILSKLLKKRTVHVLHQIPVLRRTTEGDYNIPFSVSEQRHAMLLGE